MFYIPESNVGALFSVCFVGLYKQSPTFQSIVCPEFSFTLMFWILKEIFPYRTGSKGFMD